MFFRTTFYPRGSIANQSTIRGAGAIRSNSQETNSSLNVLIIQGTDGKLTLLIVKADLPRKTTMPRT